MIVFQVRQEGVIGVRFPYDKTKVDAIKCIEGRRWNKENQEWLIPAAFLDQAVELLGGEWPLVPKEVVEEFEKSRAAGTRLIVGNTFTKIQGHDLPLEDIEEAASFWIEGAEYSKKFQDGIWDGQKHLYRKRGGLSIPTGLLSRVETLFKNKGHEYQIEDTRLQPPPGQPIQAEGPPLRDYQQEVLKCVRQNERGILQLATGAGKTLIAAHIIAEKGLDSLFFVHTKDLLYQTIEAFQKILRVPIGQIGDGRVQIEKITVATIQTAARALNVKLPKESVDEVPCWSDDESEKLTVSDWEVIQDAMSRCRLVIFDECHHVPADSFYEIAMKLPNAFFRYGLSATPWRSDRSDLMIEAALGAKLVVVNSTELIKQGFLVPPRVTMFEVLPTNRRLARNFTKVYQSEIVENSERNHLIAEVAAHCASRGRSVLILVNQIKHGHNLEQLIDGAVFIHGGNPSEVRSKALEELRQKKNHILIATTLADEGLDLPSLDALILAGAGKSETRALQRVGRVLRPSPGKSAAIIVDFFDQCLYLQKHSEYRFEIYKTEPAFEVDIRPPRLEGLIAARQRILAEN